MATNCYYINNNSFHGIQISNLNTQELLMHFVIVFSQLFNHSVKPNIRFLIKTSKLSIVLIAYIVRTCTAPLWQFQYMTIYIIKGNPKLTVSWFLVMGP